MKVLLDANLDVRLVRALHWHDVKHVVDMGWGAKSDGELLVLASGHFDCLITGDRNLPFQNPISKFDLGVVVISIGSLRLKDVLLFTPEILDAIAATKAGSVIWVRKL